MTSLSPNTLIAIDEEVEIKVKGLIFFAKRTDSDKCPWDLFRIVPNGSGRKGIIGAFGTFDRLIHSVNDDVGGDVKSIVLHVGPIPLLICELNPDRTCTYREPSQP